MSDKKISDDAVASAAELLYKGAKMLSKHCPECGLPLFEKDGRIFCSNCGDVKNEEAEGADEAGEIGEVGRGVDEGGIERARDAVGQTLMDAMERAAMRICEMIERCGDAEEVRCLTESLEKLVASMERARKIYHR